MNRSRTWLAMWLISGIAASSHAMAQDSPRRFTNLRVLPDTISEEALINVMLENLAGLGLPRRQSEGCLHCHVGDMERPVSEWNFAADDKPTKRKARIMMEMVQAINTQHLTRLDDRLAPPVRVTCSTCHAGRTDPRSLTAILSQVYVSGGVDSVISNYRRLRDRYFGANAYDFRVNVLGNLALEMAAAGAWEDGEAVARLGVEVFPAEPSPRRTLLSIRLRRTLAIEGFRAMLEQFDQMRSGPDSEAITPALLDAIAWMTFRQGAREEGVSIMRKNVTSFPDEYIPTESLAFALRDLGDAQVAIQMFEDWLSRHPNHDMARRQLINLRKDR